MCPVFREPDVHGADDFNLNLLVIFKAMLRERGKAKASSEPYRSRD
jgi:hypothetical protein